VHTPFQEKYGYDPEKASEHRNALARRDELARWERSITHFTGPLAVGQSGTIDGPIRIVQVIDDRNLLARIPHKVTKTKIISTRVPGSGLQRVGVPTRVTGMEYTLAWIAGVPTGRVVDGLSVPLPGVYTIKGTRTYETLDGTQTVFVLEPARPPSQ